MQRCELRLNTFHLKLIATAFMLADHIAHFLVPSSMAIYWFMRIVGRIAAPIFWFCFVEGYRHTSNRKKYVARLALSSLVMMSGNLIIETIFEPCGLVNVNPMSPNIFFTMFLMAVVVEYIERAIDAKDIKDRIVAIVMSLTSCAIVGLCAEYGWIAACSILCFYFIKHDTWKYLVFIVSNITICVLANNWIQIFMILSLLFIMLYKSEKPRHKMKWFFYIFYPVHLWILMTIGAFV